MLEAEEIRGRKTLPMVSVYPPRGPGLRVYGTADGWDIGALNILGEVCHYGIDAGHPWELRDGHN